MRSSALKILGWGCILGGIAWSGLWLLWLTTQHHAGKLDFAAATLGFVLFALVPSLAGWITGAIILVKAARSHRLEQDAELQTRIAEAVRTRGILNLNEASQEWSVPISLLKRSLEQLVGMNLLKGRVDWNAGKVFAPYAVLDEHCPNCGGTLEAAGVGLARCSFCGSMFPMKPGAEESAGAGN